MGIGKNWTAEEKERFVEEWGLYSLPTMAKRFNRTISAIKNKQHRFGLPDLIHSSELITLNELIENFDLNYSYDVPRLKAMGFPLRYKSIVKKRVAMVDIEEFWEFAKRHTHFFDFSKLREYTFGAEPEWVKIKRNSDKLRRTMIKPKNTPWSIGEDDLLRTLVKQHRYTWQELSERLKRTEGAIQRRLCDLKIPDRPLKADNHIKWTAEDIEQLTYGIKNNHSYELMSRDIGKSVKAIRGQVYTVYLTENLNKAGQLMGDGVFGDNRPDRCIRHKNVMKADEKELMKESLARLSGLMVFRMKQLSGVSEEFSEYWQKDLCQNWSDIDGCTKGQSDCDSCEHFKRIEPQNCKRCGATFFLKDKSTYCLRCVEDRQRQHKKKVAYMLSHNKW